MPNYIIYQNGKKVNKIVSDELFVELYCAKNDYTYEEIPMDDFEVIEPPIPLDVQLKAVSDRQDFLEDCIAEMATQVYS